MAYLRATIRMRDQRITDATPLTISGVGAPAASTACFSPYRVLVPMSPYTTQVRQAPRWRRSSGPPGGAISYAEVSRSFMALLRLPGPSRSRLERVAHRGLLRPPICRETDENLGGTPT